MKRFFSAMLAMALVLGMVLSGCATTGSINYAEHTQPAGNYRQIELSVNSGFTGNKSVLQRFYEQYPSTQYEVVAIEKVRKDWILMAGVAGGGILWGVGAVIEQSGWDDPTKDYPMSPVPPVLGGLGVLSGVVLHQIFGSTYVVTYVERQGVVPLSTQG